MSDKREKIKGRAPPTLIPVRARVISSCSYVVVQYVKKQAPSPRTMIRAKRAGGVGGGGGWGSGRLGLRGLRLMI